MKVILNIITGFILLFLVNLLPFISIPINWINLIIAGFGGVLGTTLLVLLSFMGIIL
ncbi:MAG: pro-sigmaK processing inhibitor BofA family protein [Methanosphaera sp.]|nr:pro-sigmaK processing inhibitor BofA family protein [Methanosphaera sp.]